MRIRDDDPFFTVDVPVLRIRPSTPAETARRTHRWKRSRTRKLRRRLETAAKAERYVGGSTVVSDAGQAAVLEPLPPWHEFAAGWRYVCAKYDGLFLSDDEEEQARVSYHRGGACWRTFLMELTDRKRDRGG